MKFKPLHDRVVVKRLESDEKTSGGIIIQIQLKKNQVKEKFWLLVLEKLQRMES
jgi:co-chaperonin GroES (HSP10)